ncbi:MAG: c-type cytochrome [Candidatus Lambdaproteobacteria bacterium]|nr:c-type cytochrome [Candidatus Lambdaproteobacteria bacterium]
MRDRLQLNLFWRAALFYVVVFYGGLVWLFPRVSQWAVEAPEPLPLPAAALSMYWWLLLTGLFIYVSSSEARRQAFLHPLYRWFGVRGTRRRQALRWGVLVALPAAVGGMFYWDGLPRLSSPAGIRSQHPTMPKAFAKLANPLRHLSAEQVRAYQATLVARGAADVPPEAARERLVAQLVGEGAGLYAINCRPCHGMQANGAGPMARGFRLKPADFRDPGLLPTVVESYAFWRVSKGGPGLPAASTPWDSAMPIWELDLGEEERWKVLLGEYFLSGVGPREPEKLP